MNADTILYATDDDNDTDEEEEEDDDEIDETEHPWYGHRQWN